MLPDVLDNDLKIVFCGTAIGNQSAANNAYYANPSNKFWAVLSQIALTPSKINPHDYNYKIKPHAMRGRTEKEVPISMIKQPSSAILTKVSQAKVSSRGGHPNGQFEFITYKMGLHVPHCIHS